MLAVGEHVLRAFDRRMVMIASPFAGGVGGTKEEMCGALSGGVMVIGALHGRSEAHVDDQKAKLLAVRYRERFAEEFGTTCCGPIYGETHGPGGPGSCKYVGERAAMVLLEVLEEGCQRMPSAKPRQAPFVASVLGTTETKASDEDATRGRCGG